MNFKAYDILSSLVPGFLILLAGMNMFQIKFNQDFFVAYTAIAFPLGFVMNSISSWMEDFYFWTWGGKPSNRLFNNKGIWKVHFYSGNKVKNLLLHGCNNPNASNAELFEYACRYTTGEKDSKVEDLNAAYAFSRNLLTTILIGTPFLLVHHHVDWRYYVILIPVLFVLWLRCKQRAYFYVRQVFDNYLKSKQA